MFLLLLSWFCLAVTANRANVLDKSNVDDFNLSDYCSNFNGCDEGTHVMCMYYDPLRIMGPHCSSSINYTITPDLVELMLKRINGIRAIIAADENKGGRRSPLPRGYGIIRLQWDDELAMFAQLWANQCMGEDRDFCRATKNFVSPGQASRVIKFKKSKWERLRMYEVSNEADKEILQESPKFVVEEMMREIIYHDKKFVTEDMINNFPAFEKYTRDTEEPDTSMFLHMIHGSNTHVGCGISSFLTYRGMAHHTRVQTHVLEMICNFSSDIAPDERVYDDELQGNSTGCGCPPGYREDEDCLCVKNETHFISRPCSAPVILLPIITVEDAPQEKLYNQENFVFENDSLEIKNVLKTPSLEMIQNSISMNKDIPEELKGQISKMVSRRLKDVGNHDVNENVTIPEHRCHEPIRSPNHVPHNKHSSTKKDSIFTRVSKFELPPQAQLSKRKTLPTYSKKVKKKPSIKKNDVTPRSDFGKLKELVTEYLNKNHIGNQRTRAQLVKNFIDNIVENDNKFQFQDFDVNEAGNNSSEITNTNLKRDSKLLSLLDNLEDEVKLTDLEDSVKEIVHDKIRKIYDVVGRPDGVTDYKMSDNLSQNIKVKVIALPVHTKNSHKTIHTRAHDFDAKKPIKRNRNSLRRHEKPNYGRNGRKFSALAQNARDTEISGEFNKKKLQHSQESKSDDFVQDDHNHKINSKNQDRHKKFNQLKRHNYYLKDEEDISQIDKSKHYREKLDGEHQYLRSDRKGGNQFVRPVMSPRVIVEKARPTNHMQTLYLKPVPH